MSGIVAVAGHHARRHRAGQLVLAVLTGLALAVAGGVLATARRTATAYDRLVEASGTADFRAGLIGGADLADDLAAAPGVRAAWPAVASVARVDGAGVVYVSVESGPPDPDGVVRPVVARGRAIDPSADDEVLVAQRFADELGVDVGDALTLSFLTPDEMLQFDTGFGDPDGPRLTVRIVGVMRAAGVLARTPVVAGPAFAARHGDAVSVGTALYLDVDAAPSARQRFLLAVVELTAAHTDASTGPAEFAPIELVRADDDRDSYAATARVLDIGQVVAATVVAVATMVTVAQVVSRRHRGDRATQFTEATLGLSARERTAARVLAASPAAAIAAFVAGAGVVAAGVVEPLGALGGLEPDPGWAPHTGVAVATAAVAGGWLLLAAAGAAWRAGRRSAEGRPVARPRRWSALRGIGWPPGAVGVALALPSRDGRGSAVRASQTAVTAGIAGLAAVLTFGAAVDRLVAQPERWGFTADISVIDANDDIVAALAADPLVGPMSLLSVNQLRVDGRTVHAYALADAEPGVEGPGWTILDGRRPRDDGEVVLGRRLARALDVATGATVQLADGTRLRVVGTGVGPAVNGERLGSAVLVTPGRLSASGETTGFREALVTAADPGVAEELIADLGSRYEVMVRHPPDEVANLDQLGRLPDVLALSLAGIAAAALVHSLVAAAGRRTTFDIVRALGFTPRDAAATLFATGATIVAVGLAIGLPLGVLVGRLVWWAVADAVGVATDVVVPVAGLAGVAVGAAATAAAGALVAALPLLRRGGTRGGLRTGRGGAAPLSPGG